MQVKNKKGVLEEFNPKKIVNAVSKASSRAMVTLSEIEFNNIVSCVRDIVNTLEVATVAQMHNAVEKALDSLGYDDIVKNYREYRNYKKDFVEITDKAYTKKKSLQFIGDKENANTDSALVATKRCLVYNELNKEFYRKFFMSPSELEACKKGYIYIHDQNARLDTFNCFRRDTRFITSKGVKSFYDFSDGDKVKVLSHKGIWRDATVHSYGWQKLQKVTFKRGSKSFKEVYVTPNHRWILKDGTETTNLKVGDRLISTPVVSDYDWELLTREEKKLWCLGFGFGDGSITDNNSIPTMSIRLCGNKKEHSWRFKDVGYTVSEPKSYNGDLHVMMYDVHAKEIPYLELNYDNVKYFVHGYMCADGHKKSSENHLSEFRGVLVSGKMNEYIYDLLNMSGYYVTNIKDMTGQVTNYGTRLKETKQYGLFTNSGDRTWKVVNIEPCKLNSKSVVWCLDVDVDHSFILENGIPTGNCCLYDMKSLLKNGFEMGNLWYNEPKTLDTAFDVINAIILSTASQQYGGWTAPEVDKLLKPYAEKSYSKYANEYLEIAKELIGDVKVIPSKVHEYAMMKVKRDFEQGWQGVEMTLNSVGSSRGDYPFITMTFGLDTSDFGKMASKTFLKVHSEGQGKEGKKKPVLFPKLVFIYDKALHGEGCANEDVFEAGIDCSCTTMYPDWLSVNGNTTVAEMYRKYGEVISPMGCRAFLSPWYERGGMYPADDEDKPVFVGRFNIGAVSLHLPMIYAKAIHEEKDFYEVLDYYLEMIRGVHKRTYEYLGEMKASTNPVAFCEGGIYGGHLKPNEKIKPLLKAMTASFGITALNELQQLHNRKSLVEDNTFAKEVMVYINKKVEQFKKEDGWLYAIYGTPAENLCFSGDTIVQVYGGNKSIKDINNGDLVYTYNESENKIELKPVICSMMTSEKAVVVKVKFNNGQTVVCTPKHPFAMRKIERNSKGQFIREYMEYVEAKDLKNGDRIKSNYRQVTHNGRCIFTTNQYEHDVVAEYFYGEKPEGYVVHHKDENKMNNLVENLVYMTDVEHRRIHMKDTIGKFCYTSKSQTGKNNTFYGKSHSNETKELNRQSHIGKNNVLSKALIKLDLDGNILAEYESAGQLYREDKNFTNISYALNGKSNLTSYPQYCGHYHKGYLWYFKSDIENVSFENHIVESVEFLDEEIPVYDITVKDNHNFYVGGEDGILVHNCGLQVEQFRKEYGIIENVSDREYVSNSFHCHVTENISPIVKQDKEFEFWNLFEGGRIQYARYNLGYNREAVKTLVRRAMEEGAYEGVNLALSFCDDCGCAQVEMEDICPICGSKNLTKIDRMNGYLAYSRVKGDTRLNKAKMAEISERKSM